MTKKLLLTIFFILLLSACELPKEAVNDHSPTPPTQEVADDKNVNFEI